MSGLAFTSSKVQRLRRLTGRRSARTEARAFVVEGAKVLSEALAAGVVPEAVFHADGAPADLLDRALDAGSRLHRLADGVLERVAGTVTPQPVLAIVPMVDVDLAAVGGASLLVVCAGLRDPGNLGTVLRSAEAAGAGGVVCCDGSVDPYNPKAVRASAGSVFHVPLVVGGDAVAVLEQLEAWSVRRIGATAHGGADYATVDLTGPIAFVLGNEAAGLEDSVATRLDLAVTIPHVGRTESLNVGMAAAVLCFEAARQRRSARAD